MNGVVIVQMELEHGPTFMGFISTHVVPTLTLPTVMETDTITT